MIKQPVISKASTDDMPYIKEKIKKYWLDPNNLDVEQFYIGKIAQRRVVFGRIIDYKYFFEIASLGVDFYYRRYGRARLMLDFLLKEARARDKKKDIYCVTHIPEFFTKFGFAIIEHYPAKLDEKIKKVCKSHYSKIKVLKYEGSL